jgi:hypothetical protein
MPSGIRNPARRGRRRLAARFFCRLGHFQKRNHLGVVEEELVCTTASVAHAATCASKNTHSFHGTRLQIKSSSSYHTREGMHTRGASMNIQWIKDHFALPRLVKKDVLDK